TLRKAIGDAEPWDTQWPDSVREFIIWADFKALLGMGDSYRSSGIDKAIALAIIDVCEQNKSKKITVSYRTLADKAGIGSTRTVQASLKRLDGILFKRTQDNQSGSYYYEIVIDSKVNINTTQTRDYSVSLTDDIADTDYVQLTNDPSSIQY